MGVDDLCTPLLFFLGTIFFIWLGGLSFVVFMGKARAFHRAEEFNKATHLPQIAVQSAFEICTMHYSTENF